jgi:hypothetical protein
VPPFRPASITAVLHLYRLTSLPHPVRHILPSYQNINDSDKKCKKLRLICACFRIILRHLSAVAHGFSPFHRSMSQAAESVSLVEPE